MIIMMKLLTRERFKGDAVLNSSVPFLSLVFVLTLRDFRGGSVFSHLCKEVLPRHILSKEAMNTLWNHMKKIEDKVRSEIFFMNIV